MFSKLIKIIFTYTDISTNHRIELHFVLYIDGRDATDFVNLVKFFLPLKFGMLKDNIENPETYFLNQNLWSVWFRTEHDMNLNFVKS